MAMDKATLEAILRSDLPAEVKASLIRQDGESSQAAPGRQSQQAPLRPGQFDIDDIKPGMSKEEQARCALEIARAINEG